ncbi:MAG: type III pantothenate kinase [Pseudomonadota bacterium]|jgi:type III pantothenate kinase|nr:MAG: type III pantothenate kinase [Pseudomonadota bacterium]
MSVLLVDIGNTRVKWARLGSRGPGRPHAAVHVGWSARDFERFVFRDAEGIERVLVSNVAGEQVARHLTAAARRRLGIRAELVRSVRSAGGVTTRYAEPWRLGVDRFVAAIGAHDLVGARAACVISVGTAVTLDLVDAAGVHRGGAIVPGPRLMIESLLHNTDGIGKRARGDRRRSRGLFARGTREAIEQGARHAVAAVIDRFVAEARAELGTRPVVLLTGGAAPEIRPLLRTRCRDVPDLVLRGLAVLARSETR